MQELIPSIYSEASRREKVKKNLGTGTFFGKSRRARCLQSRGLVTGKFQPCCSKQ